MNSAPFFEFYFYFMPLPFKFEAEKLHFYMQFCLKIILFENFFSVFSNRNS